MTIAEAKDKLVSAITAIQTLSGRPLCDLEDEIVPFRDLDGFDSLNGEEVCTLLSIELDFDKNTDFFTDAQGIDRTIEDIAVIMAQKCTPRMVAQ